MPESKIIYARNLTIPPEFQHGNMRLRIKTLQNIRGSCQRRLNASAFWKVGPQSVAGLIGFPDEKSVMIRCGKAEIWKGFFSTMSLLRQMGDDCAIFAKLFTGMADRLLGFHKRFTVSRKKENTTRLAGSETPLILAGPNWDTGELYPFRHGDVLTHFTTTEHQRYIVA